MGTLLDGGVDSVPGCSVWFAHGGRGLMTTMRTWGKRFGWMLAGIALLYGTSALAGVASSGPLDPPGLVGSTMQSLSDLPPAWHQILPANDGADACSSSRFTCVLGGAAVLDHETGLVWQRVVTAAAADWRFANVDCGRASAGGRAGWRLPSRAELMSLVVPLPAGHPFTIPFSTYWTIEDDIESDTSAGVVNIGSASYAIAGKELTFRYICVRGGSPLLRGDSSERPGSWSTEFSYNPNGGECDTNRFGCNTSENLVLDRMTGLQWQRTPSATQYDWIGAVNACMTLGFLGYGWRLPQAHELRSLGDDLSGLPLGHPFAGISGTYWTTTTGLAAAGGAYVVDFADLETPNVDAKVSPTSKAWCVRGPGDGVDGM